MSGQKILDGLEEALVWNRGFVEGLRRCLMVIESELELPGTMPTVLHDAPLEEVMRATVRATKKSIADRIRRDGFAR